MLNKVKTTIAEHELLEPGDSVLVALSGGPDSVALLHLLSRLKRSMKLSLHAAYVNHGIRVKAAAQEEKFCRHLCDKLKVELTMVREDVPSLAKRVKKSVEEAGRDLRYRVFAQLADQHNCKRIALGHHADDNVETILFRVLRGTGKRGLTGIPIKRGMVIRPLLTVSKADILAYLKKQRVAFCIDQSNAALDYSRNFIRNQLLPQVRERLNPSVDRALLNLAETSLEEERYLAAQASSRLKNVRRKTVGGKIELDLVKLRTYDVWLRRRVLRHCIAECLRTNTQPDKTQVDRLDTLAVDKGKAISLRGRLQAEIVARKLVLYRRERIRFSVRLKPGVDCLLDRLLLTVRCLRQRYTGQLDRKRRSRTVVLDLAKLEMPLTVRSIRSGDRFRPLGLKGSRKVGDYLTDRKVPPVYRDEIPVVCDSDGIVWLVGFEIADRVKVDSSTKEVLKIEIVRPRKKAVAAV
ncbi:MAG: tRNA lysidine(34) synthetase TilS [candidate division Zixibacteria bacterium]|nr:tRNA lysidine(34) synthetase TilS [candidate division Zixibacteria bacterium]MDH3938936.1 tRNA lysidine(34) synthetase TilS [candidate division Zixibacteria bacterium]MDH4033426.1 tRNA lysidine(34) synthetase TilS [candidate division Zixibacteria bacterium]